MGDEPEGADDGGSYGFVLDIFKKALGAGADYFANQSAYKSALVNQQTQLQLAGSQAAAAERRDALNAQLSQSRYQWLALAAVGIAAALVLAKAARR